MHGKVLWFNSAKGYGFIELEDGRELFFHHSHIDISNEYRVAYSGTPVKVMLDEDNENIIKVTILNRISYETNKPIALIAFMLVCEGSTLTHFNFDIARKSESGIKYLYICNNLLICSDKELDVVERENIRYFIENNHFQLGKPINIGLRYDIMFI